MAPRVLLIEDSEFVLEMVKDALEEIGCDVEAHREPSRSCLEGDGPPDLVLLDVKMPRAQGDDIAQLLKTAWSEACLVYLYSSLPEAELSQRAEKAGVDGFICKSWGRKRLLEEVGKLLALDSTPDSSSDQEDGRRSLDRERKVINEFIRRCHKRQKALELTLEARDEGDNLAQVSVAHLNDLLSEARMLGLDLPVSLCSELLSIIDDLGPALKGSRVRRCLGETFDHLSAVAEGSALLLAESAFRDELVALKQLGRTSPTRPSRRPQERGSSRRVLVCDDSPVVLEILTLELEDRGHQVAQASCLSEFSRELESFDPELVFMDVSMPDNRGDELVKLLRLQRKTKRIPVILFSSLPEEELQVVAQKAGADGYFSKQRGMDDLVKYFDDLLAEIIF